MEPKSSLLSKDNLPYLSCNSPLGFLYYTKRIQQFDTAGYGDHTIKTWFGTFSKLSAKQKKADIEKETQPSICFLYNAVRLKLLYTVHTVKFPLMFLLFCILV